MAAWVASQIILLAVGIWSTIIMIIGFRELHEISTLRAILAWLIPVIILVVIAIIVWERLPPHPFLKQ